MVGKLLSSPTNIRMCCKCEVSSNKHSICILKIVTEELRGYITLPQIVTIKQLLG